MTELPRFEELFLELGGLVAAWLIVESIDPKKSIERRVIQAQELATPKEAA